AIQYVAAQGLEALPLRFVEPQPVGRALAARRRGGLVGVSLAAPIEIAAGEAQVERNRQRQQDGETAAMQAGQPIKNRQSALPRPAGSLRSRPGPSWSARGEGRRCRRRSGSR